MSSRILTVSTSRPQAHDLISRLINDDDSATNIDPDADIVPWTIKNKYYTAEVEFHVKVIASKSEPVDFSGASAIIFVFHKNEGYRSLFDSIGTEHDAESSLAISVKDSSNTDVGASADDLEDFFSQRGFEYIDADAQDEGADDDFEEHTARYDVRGIDRITQALHTVMWPNLVRATGPRKSMPQRDDSLLDEGSDTLSDDDATEVDIDAAAQSLFLSQDHESTERDLRALESWLDDKSDPWLPQLRKTSSSVSFTPLSAYPDEPKASSSGEPDFADDFTDFVSAPANSKISDSSQFVKLEDPDLPSSAEICSVSQRIFGGAIDTDAPGGFDLSQVLGALQSMKEDIGSITDEAERRKAAARVALGLVSGLDADTSDLE